ncbi:MAG: Gfo/Idh/MocA family oxidoreductase [Candidatus Omnitrophica bacterium]|nr:Gfo/Idh/MocA family oxidoreductase [Candidatus Omnitrophota bacterium]
MKLRAGIIGLGVGEAHIAGYESHPLCEVTHLCDFSDEKMAEAKRKYPHCVVEKDANAILDNPAIDVVSIASYDNFHHEQIVKAIRNGKHVFVEKPLCLFEKEAAEIRKLLREHPQVRLSSNLILRSSPRFRRLKQLIQQGDFGTLFSIDGSYLYGRLHKITEGWRGSLDYYSVILGGAVHIIDLMTWLSSDQVEEVKAYGNQIASAGSQFRYDDFSDAILKFKSGMIGRVSANFGCVHPHFHSFSIYGTQATFLNARPDGVLYRSSDPQVLPEPVTEEYPGVKKGDLIRNFIESLIGEAKPEVTAEDVFNTMSICFAIEKAIKTNSTVKVDYL